MSNLKESLKREKTEVTWKIASEDSPIFSGRFVTSSRSSSPGPKQLRKSLLELDVTEKVEGPTD